MADWLTEYLKGYRTAAYSPYAEDDEDPRERDWRAQGPRFMRPQTPAGRLFDVLQRGNYMTANMALEAGRITRDPVDDPWYRAAWETLKAGGRGLAGREKVFFEDVLGEAAFGKKMHPVGRAMLGLGLDIGLDPLTYAGVGLSKLGRVAKLASMAQKAKGLSWIPKAGTKAVDIGQVSMEGLNRFQRWRRLIRLRGLNRGIEKLGLKGMGVDQLVKLYEAGPVSRAAAGMSGLNLFGRPVVKGQALARWSERVVPWLLEDPWVYGAKSGKVYKFLDENIPLLRRGLRASLEKVIPGETLHAARSVIQHARRRGARAQSLIQVGITDFMRGAKGLYPGGVTDEIQRQVLQILETTPFHGVVREADELSYALKAGHGKGAIKAYKELTEPERAAKLAELAVGAIEKPAEELTERALRRLGVKMKKLDTGETIVEHWLEIAKQGTEVEQHWLHAVNPDAMRYAERHFGHKKGVLLKLRRFIRDPGQMRRQIRMPLVDANAVATGQRTGIDVGDLLHDPDFHGVVFPKKTPLFIEDIPATGAIRARRVGDLTTQAELIDGLKVQFMKPASAGLEAAGWRTPIVTLSEELGGGNPLDKFMADPILANEIEKVWDRLFGIREVGDLMRMYDKTLTLWRGYALLAPSYHVRNAFSNVWQNFLGGVSNPERYTAALQFQMAAKRVPTDGGAALRNIHFPTMWGSINGQDLYKSVIDEQLLGGFFSEWRRGLVPEQLPGQARGVAKIHRNTMKFNMAVGTAVENNARMALFLDRIAKGDDVATAAGQVRKFLFDYSDLGLTVFENERIRRLTSFYRWTKNNLVLSMEQLAMQPGKYAGISKVKHAIEETLGKRGGEPPSEAYMPKWMAEGLAVRVYGGQQPAYFVLKNWLPALQPAELFEDFDRIPIPGLRWAAGIAAPPISLPIEQILNKSLYYDRPVKEYAEERRRFLGTYMDPRLSHVARIFRPASEINRFLRGTAPMRAGMELATGRVHTYDYPAEQRWGIYAKNRRLSQLKRDLKRALRKGHHGEAQRLRRTIIELRRTRVVR